VLNTLRNKEVSVEQELEQWCPDYVTTGFVAGHCGVCNVTVLRWIDKGRLPAFRLLDGHYRIRRDDFAGFLERYSIPASQGASSGSG